MCPRALAKKKNSPLTPRLVLGRWVAGWREHWVLAVVGFVPAAFTVSGATRRRPASSSLSLARPLASPPRGDVHGGAGPLAAAGSRPGASGSCLVSPTKPAARNAGCRGRHAVLV